ncbi:MAG: hypothetical protein NVSMB54_21490 [Ktedonobacteraceae bacterium]
MLVVVLFIGLSILGAIIITFLPKTPSSLSPIANLVGIPIPGQKMILHGGRFAPGETVIVVIDQKASAFSTTYSSNRASIGELFSQHTAQTPSGIREIVRVDGTFSLTFPVDASWPIGSVHTVYVYKQDGTLVKLPPFTVIAPSVSTGLVGCLDQTTPIKLGPIDENSTQSISKTIALCTQGSGIVKWQASWEQAWLKLPSSGQIQAPQTGHLPITGSAKGLKPGAYITTITLSSRQSSALVRLTIVLVVTKTGTANAHSLPPGSKRTLLQTRTIECISIAPQAVSFASFANQPDMLSKSVQVNNCGNNEQWSASVRTNDGTTWLGINTSQGKIPSGWFQEVTITVSSAALPPGVYSGQVTFYTGTSNVEVKVTFTVLSPNTTSSCINVKNQSFAFVGTAGQDDPPSQTTTLINCGATGQWSAATVTDDGADWIHVSPRSHTLNEKGKQQVNVSVSSIQLSGGTYTGKITFLMGTSSVKVNVTFVVQKACIQVDYPALLYKSRVDEGPLRNIITITNCGFAGTWNASTSTENGAKWLTINKISGSLAAKAKESIAVDVASAHLHEGIYTGDILFIMGTSKATVSVKFVIIKPATPPCLSVNTNELNFATFEGRRPDTQVLTIGNCGSVAVSWNTLMNGTPWISTDIPRGELKQGGDSEDERITLSSEHLTQGTYKGRITLSTGSNSKDVTITLTVQKHVIPCIIVDKSSLEFSSMRTSDGIVSPAPQTVKITNCGDPAFLSAPIVMDDRGTWLGVSPFKENLSTGELSSVSILINSTGLKNGSYTAAIPFTVTVSTGAKESVNVSIQLTVAPPIKITPCTANPSKLTFNSNWEDATPPAQTVTLMHCGANDTWQQSDDGSIFNVGPFAGTLDNTGSQVINVVPDSRSLDPGQYTQTITFTTGAGNMASIDATWIITPPHKTTCIQTDSSSLNLDQSANSPNVVSFSNCGTDVGSIKVTKATSDCCVDWLAINAYGDSSIDGSGTFPTGYGPSISVTAYGTNVPSGRHHGTVTGIITGAQGIQKVATIDVIFTVLALPTAPPPTFVPIPTSIPVVTDTPTDTPTVGVTPTDTPTMGVTPTDTPTTGVTPTDTPTTVPPTDTPVPTQVPTTAPPTDTPVPTQVPTTAPPTDTPVPTQVPTTAPPTDTPTSTPH